jgi:hypothetical protein
VVRRSLSCRSWRSSRRGRGSGGWRRSTPAQTGQAEAGQEGIGPGVGVVCGGARGALCYGWIDSQGSRFDENYYLQRFTPRRARSKWSQINRDKVIALIEAGKVKPAGLAEVERAQADGRWDEA